MAEPPPPAKRPRFDDVATFKVLVGPKEVPFLLHENIACSQSKFFRAAVKGKFKEADERIVRLVHAEVDTFNLYVQWIYFHGNIIEDPKVFNKNNVGPKYYVLTKLYVLADSLEDVQIRNRVNTELGILFTSSNTTPNWDTISFAYSQTANTSTLRKLVLHLFARSREPAIVEWIRLNKDRMPADFIFELCLEWGNKALDGSLKPLNACEFHEHDEEFPACSSK